jgi:hypothetical protein
MGVSLYLGYTNNGQNIENNTTNVTVTVVASWTNGSYCLTSKPGFLIIDGTQYNFTSPFNTGRSNSGSVQLFSKTVNVTHESDGTKTLVCAGQYTTGVSSGTIAASFSKVLPTIPRKSTVSATNGTLGTAQTLTVSRHSSGFTHTITYKCGDTTGTICTKSSSTSISWTPPMSLANENPTGTTVSVTLTITTYNGNASLGSTTKIITCAIPASVKPSVSISVSNATSSISTNYIQGMSKVRISISAAGANGSTIKSYKTTFDGKTYTTSSFTSSTITGKGGLLINCTVTDSRGRTGTASTSITVQAYTPPVINILTVHRCDANGTSNDQGGYIKAVCSYSVSSSGGTPTVKIEYKKTSATTYTTATITSNEYIFQADTGSSYNVQLVVSDKFNSVKRATTASTAFTLMHWNAEGNGMGIGKISEEENMLDIGLDARFNNPVYGKALGMDRLPAVPANSDFNDYLDPGCYAVHANDIAKTCKNIPVAVAGRLEVWSATGEGVRLEQYSYLRQRFVPYNRSNPTWEREINRNANNVWTYHEWWRSSLTPTASTNVYYEQKVLWGADMSSGYYMTGGQTADLSEPISDQPHGIMLVFSNYTSSTDTNYGWQCFFVPKIVVAQNLDKGSGHIFNLSSRNFGSTGTKYIYITDTQIKGHDDNNKTGTSTTTGITYANNKFVLRYVIGV